MIPTIIALPGVHGWRVTLRHHAAEIVLMPLVGGTNVDIAPLVDTLRDHYSSSITEPAYHVALRKLRGLGWEPVACPCFSALAGGGSDLDTPDCETCGGLGHVWRRCAAEEPK